MGLSDIRGSRNCFRGGGGGGGGGGGVQARRPENSLDNFFLNPQLILQIAEGVQWFYYIGNITFPRIQGGEGGGPGPTTRKQSGQLFFKSSTYFTDCRGGPMVLLHRKHYFSKDPEGVQHLQGGGGPTFSKGGPNACFYLNPYNL